MKLLNIALFSTFWIFLATRFLYGTVEVFKNPSLALYMITISEVTGSPATSLTQDWRMSFYLFLGADPNEPQYWGRSAFEEAVVTENINAIRKLTPLVSDGMYLQGAKLACVSSHNEILEFVFKVRGEKLLRRDSFCSQ